MTYKSIHFHSQGSVVSSMVWLILAGLVWSSVAQLRDQLGLAAGYDGLSPASCCSGTLAGTGAAAWGMLGCARMEYQGPLQDMQV